MPTVLAQSNLPKSAAVVVSSETIILRDPNNNILEKYTSDEQKQKSLKSYGIKPATMLSPGENKTSPDTKNLTFYRWLQNNGEACINSLIKPKFNYKYEFAVKAISSSYPFLFGASDHDASDTGDYKSFRAYMNYRSEQLFTLYLYMTNTGNNYTTITNISNDFEKITIEDGKYYVNDEEIGTIASYDPETALDTYLFIFCYSNYNTPQFRGNFRLAYFRIYDEYDNILRDFVPASQDGIFGLYDKVSHTLFINANENGSFVGGNDDSIPQDSNTFGFGNVNTPDIIDNESESM